MAIFLLDTNVIIDALNGKKDRNPFLLGLIDQGHLLACCPINVAEVYAGVRPKEELTFPSRNSLAGSNRAMAAEGKRSAFPTPSWQP